MVMRENSHHHHAHQQNHDYHHGEEKTGYCFLGNMYLLKELGEMILPPERSVELITLVGSRGIFSSRLGGIFYLVYIYPEPVYFSSDTAGTD